MYISHKRNCAYGHKKWSDAHQSEVKKPSVGKDVSARIGDGVVAANPDLDDTMITPERPHRPWLVPGVDTL